MPTNAIDIADELLRIAKSEGQAMTPQKLIKLVWIAHAVWYEMRAGKTAELFSINEIENWKYGPMIPVIYRATKKYGRSEIPLDVIKMDDVKSRVDQKTSDFLKEVFEKYGNFSGIQLSAMVRCWKEGQ